VYDIICLINDAYDISILTLICWMLTGVLFCLYEVLFIFKVWGITHVLYAITYSVLFFEVTFYRHTAMNEVRSSRILVQKLLLEGNVQKRVCKQTQKLFFVTSGNGKRVYSMWILFTKCKAFCYHR